MTNLTEELKTGQSWTLAKIWGKIVELESDDSQNVVMLLSNQILVARKRSSCLMLLLPPSGLPMEIGLFTSWFLHCLRAHPMYHHTALEDILCFWASIFHPDGFVHHHDDLEPSSQPPWSSQSSSRKEEGYVTLLSWWSVLTICSDLNPSRSCFW